MASFLFNQYRYDRDVFSDDMPERVRQSLYIPVVQSVNACKQYPVYAEYLMDFIQESNIALLEAHKKFPLDMNINQFQYRVTKDIRWCIYDYFSRVHHIYIDPARRYALVHYHDKSSDVEQLQYHTSLEHLLSDPFFDVPESEKLSHADKRDIVSALVSTLPEKERIALLLFFGIDDDDGHERSSAEIATVIGVIPNTARTFVNKAIKRLAHESVAKSKEVMVREREARLEAFFHENPDVGVVQLSRLAKCSHVESSRFLKAKKGIDNGTRAVRAKALT
jgi:RNA polymerase sigma factor (sigma-70 family)